MTRIVNASEERAGQGRPPLLRLLGTMARKLRGCFAGRLVEVTTRTLQSRHLLRPGRRTNQIVVGVLARAQQRTGICIVGPVAMSNHIHLLVVPRSTRQLSVFMRYVNSNVARKVGRLHGWKGKFWEKRYTAIVVTDEEQAQVGRLRYLLSQGVKEGLVQRPEDWPGVHVARALQSGYPEISGGVWHDRTAQRRAGRRSSRGSARARDFDQKSLCVGLCPLPCWSELSWSQRRAATRRLIREVVSEARRERKGRPVFGARAVLDQDPFSAPEQSERRPAPPCHAASRKARRELTKELRAFAAAFFAASEALRKGETADFPAGCFPPGLPYVAESSVPDG
ncbi:MAG: transposase [Acidobacteriota bacterium]